MSNTTLPASIESLGKFLKHVTDCALEQGFTAKKIGEMRLAAEEVLVNIFQNAYPKENGEVEVSCSLREDHAFIIKISDAGIPFNPLELPEPDIGADLSQRKIGGLGVFLVRKLMDEIEYRRENNRNVLTLISFQT